MMTKAKLGALALAIAFAPGIAQADSSCDALFARARATGAPSPEGNYVKVLWSTNYFVPARPLRFMGHTDLVMRTEPNGDLTATGYRHRRQFQLNALIDISGERVSLRVRADGKIMFNDQYGPYDPVCSGDRFVRVSSGDSLETFSFRDMIF
jgi:hypothetical protein